MQEGGSELGEINISKISPFLRSHSSQLNSGRRPSCRRERQGSPSAAQAAGAVTAHFGFLSRIFLTIVLNSGGDGSDRRVGRRFFVRQVDTFSSIERGGKQTRPLTEAVGRCGQRKRRMPDYSGLGRKGENQSASFILRPSDLPARSTHKSDGRSRNRDDNGGGERVAKGRAGEQKVLGTRIKSASTVEWATHRLQEGTDYFYTPIPPNELISSSKKKRETATTSGEMMEKEWRRTDETEDTPSLQTPQIRIS